MKPFGPLLACLALAPCVGCGGGGGGGGDNGPALAALKVSDGLLKPSFRADVSSYAVGPSSSLPSIVTITPTVAHEGETVTVEGFPVASGAESGFLHLGGGTNVFVIVVRAADGGEQRTYSIAFEVASADLSSLEASAGALSPAFLPGVTNYVVGPPVTLDTSTITPRAVDPDAIVTVNGQVVAYGTPSQPFPVTADLTNVPVTVFSRDGTTKTYTVQFDRIDAVFYDDFSSPTLGPLWLGASTFDTANGVPPPSRALESGQSLEYIGTPVLSTNGVTLTVDVQRDAATQAKVSLFHATSPTTVSFSVELSDNWYDVEYRGNGASASGMGFLAPDTVFHRVELKITPAGTATFSLDGTPLIWVPNFPTTSLRFSLSHTTGGGMPSYCRFDTVTLQSP